MTLYALCVVVALGGLGAIFGMLGDYRPKAQRWDGNHHPYGSVGEVADKYKTDLYTAEALLRDERRAAGLPAHSKCSCGECADWRRKAFP